jgi:hypothetical protein
MRRMRRIPLFASACLLLAAVRPPQQLLLEIRVFNGTEEVTSQTRITVHRAGDRGSPIGRLEPGSPKRELALQADIYDAQAIQEREGRVVNIRWAQRLVVMPYPDEHGRHLEVINFQSGFGALQVRDPGGDVALYRPAERTAPVASQFTGADYVLFVVPAGRYDLRVRTPKSTNWHSDVEVPVDRTRLWTPLSASAATAPALIGLP